MSFDVRHVATDGEKLELDDLLWEVLWKPLGFPRKISDAFKLDSPQLDLVAVDGGTVIGGLVANWLSDAVVEIRHLAVAPDRQRSSVGTGLVVELKKSVGKHVPVTIQTYARNTSIGFFTKLGFRPTGERLRHQEFSTHGIDFHLMQMTV